MTDSQIKRTGYKFKHPGPYLAMVKNHLDPEFNGSVQVALISGAVDNADNVAGQYVTVRYCSPFAGNTSVDFNDEPVSNKKVTECG
jgi:hypothetical protein